MFFIRAINIDTKHSLETIAKQTLDNTFIKACYMHERTGWKMRIHDDHPDTCKLTVIVYIPKSDPPDDNELGTSLYNQDGTLYCRTDYKYNVGHFFVPTSKRFRRTLHAFDGHIPNERHSILIQYLTHTDIDINNPRIPILYDGFYGSKKPVIVYNESDVLWPVDS